MGIRTERIAGYIQPAGTAKHRQPSSGINRRTAGIVRLAAWRVKPTKKAHVFPFQGAAILQQFQRMTRQRTFQNLPDERQDATDE